MDRIGTRHERLCRDASRIHACAAKFMALDNGDGFAGTRKSRRQGRARLARPDNDCVEVLYRSGQRAPPYVDLAVLTRQCKPRLSRPLPVSNFFFVDAFSVSVVNARDDLTLQPFLDVGADGTQTRDTIDDVDCQIEAVDLIENREFERSVDAALFLVPAHMYVVVILCAGK